MNIESSGRLDVLPCVGDPDSRVGDHLVDGAGHLHLLVEKVEFLLGPCCLEFGFNDNFFQFVVLPALLEIAEIVGAFNPVEFDVFHLKRASLCQSLKSCYLAPCEGTQ